MENTSDSPINKKSIAYIQDLVKHIQVGDDKRSDRHEIRKKNH